MYALKEPSFAGQTGVFFRYFMDAEDDCVLAQKLNAFPIVILLHPGALDHAK